MKNIQKISIFMLTVSSFAFAQDTQNEEEELSTVEALLALVKEGKTVEQAANADRESKFIANKNKQAYENINLLISKLDSKTKNGKAYYLRAILNLELGNMNKLCEDLEMANNLNFKTGNLIELYCNK